MYPKHPPLLYWTFDNIVSERGVSTAVGIPADPQLISGFISQTGGGPAEHFGPDVGPVFLTRHLGTHEVFMWITITQTMAIGSVTFRHWHNHNPGYPTHPSYRVQLQIDCGQGYESCAVPLHLSDTNSGGFDEFGFSRVLDPGSYKFRWHPQALKNKARDTSSEFFALRELTVHGCPARPGAPRTPYVKLPWSVPIAWPADTPGLPCEPPTCPVPEVTSASDAPPASAPPDLQPDGAALPKYVTIDINGVTVEHLKVMRSQFEGVCARSGEPFVAGAVIGFKHRAALTDAQRLAIFGPGKSRHLTVALTPAECGGTEPNEDSDEDDD